MKFCFLSHPYKIDQPAYGGKIRLSIKSIKSIINGDPSNEYEITIQNHWGTHIDAPNHFFSHGKKVIDYPPDFWVFIHPKVIDVTIKENEILNTLDFNLLDNDTDLLLLRSGWSKRRDEDAYCIANPGIDPNIAMALRKNLPELRAVGIDWISVSSFKNRELGRMAHRNFLNPDGPNNPILIIEDMDLPDNLEGLQYVIVIPLRFEGIDSSPCTVIAILK